MLNLILPSLPSSALGGRAPYGDRGEAGLARGRAVPLLSFGGNTQNRADRADPEPETITIEGWAEWSPYGESESAHGARRRPGTGVGYGLYLPFVVQYLAQEAVPTGLHRERWSEGVRAYQRAEAAWSSDGGTLSFAA